MNTVTRPRAVAITIGLIVLGVGLALGLAGDGNTGGGVAILGMIVLVYAGGFMA